MLQKQVNSNEFCGSGGNSTQDHMDTLDQVRSQLQSMKQKNQAAMRPFQQHLLVEQTMSAPRLFSEEEAAFDQNKKLDQLFQTLPNWNPKAS